MILRNLIKGEPWRNGRLFHCDMEVTGSNLETAFLLPGPSVRKQHNSGYKHKANVRTYYQQFEEQQTQILIDQKIKEHLGQTAAFQQGSAAYTSHLSALRPRLPMLPLPVMPIPGAVPSPLVSGVRPPVLPGPIPGAPGYGAIPSMAPTVVLSPGAPTLPVQINGLPRPPTLNAPTTVPGGIAAPGSNRAPSSVSPSMYQANPTGSTAPSASTNPDSYSAYL